jgi:YD repeat-containing protein
VEYKASVDAEGRRTEMAYDSAGRVTRVEDALENAATFIYDANGNREGATDARSNTTTFTYDVVDNLAGVTDPLSNETAYTYDRNYNLASVTISSVSPADNRIDIRRARATQKTRRRPRIATRATATTR